MLKRLIDIALSAIGIVLLAPLMLIMALAIKCESPGPVFYRQERVGQHGKLFRIFKFRTMREIAPSQQTSEITVAGDSRITQVGGFLRRTKLDELAQIIDVLRGTMSLVGPRPEVPRYVALYPANLRTKVLSVRPGLTDIASLEYRFENDLLAQATDPQQEYIQVILPAKLQLAAQYVDQASVMFDLKLMWRTLGVLWVKK